MASAGARPLLKWAGGKRQLLPALRAYYPSDFDRYVEPFVGSGAVFFDLYASAKLDGRRVRLADVNPDLVGCYRVVRDEADALIAALADLEAEHSRRGTACYYEVRDRRFNPARASLGRDADRRYTPALAAMLIYLNRTGYNGLFRLNSRGGFNVPAGRYVNPRICQPDHIREVARALSSARVIIECTPFDRVLAESASGDFVYCDPPYAPISETAKFANYTAAGFGAADQVRLQQHIVDAARRGAVVLVSNSSAPEIDAAYRARPARDAGLQVRTVPARRAINSRGSRRGVVDELIITNVGSERGTVKMPPLRMARSRPRTAARTARTA